MFSDFGHNYSNSATKQHAINRINSFPLASQLIDRFDRKKGRGLNDQISIILDRVPNPPVLPNIQPHASQLTLARDIMNAICLMIMLLFCTNLYRSYTKFQYKQSDSNDPKSRLTFFSLYILSLNSVKFFY